MGTWALAALHLEVPIDRSCNLFTPYKRNDSTCVEKSVRADLADVVVRLMAEVVIHGQFRNESKLQTVLITESIVWFSWVKNDGRARKK